MISLTAKTVDELFQAVLFFILLGELFSHFTFACNNNYRLKSNVKNIKSDFPPHPSRRSSVPPFPQVESSKKL